MSCKKCGGDLKEDGTCLYGCVGSVEKADNGLTDLKQKIFDLKNEYDLQVITSIDFVEKVSNLLADYKLAQYKTSLLDRLPKELDDVYIISMLTLAGHCPEVKEIKAIQFMVSNILASVKSLIEGDK